MSTAVSVCCDINVSGVLDHQKQKLAVTAVCPSARTNFQVNDLMIIAFVVTAKASNVVLVVIEFYLLLSLARL